VSLGGLLCCPCLSAAPVPSAERHVRVAAQSALPDQRCLDAAHSCAAASLTTSSGSVQQLREGRLAHIRGGVVWHKPPKVGTRALHA
jgi:hypothetical protein